MSLAIATKLQRIVRFLMKSKEKTEPIVVHRMTISKNQVKKSRKRSKVESVRQN